MTNSSHTYLQASNIVTSRLVLKPVSPWSFARISFHWTLDAEAMSDMTLKPTGWTRLRWWKQIRKLSRKNRLCHGIWLKNEETLIGIHMVMMQFPAMDAVSGVLIGEKKWRGKGYGAEAKMAVTDHLFRNCGAHRITSWVNSRNFASLHMNVRCGFKKEAQMREQVVLLDGSRADFLGFGLLRKDWEILYATGANEVSPNEGGTQ